MWVRGLKQSDNVQCRWSICVAPHVGAWIETLLEHGIPKKWRVAPHVGAWIETTKWLLNRVDISVAPHVGAWIETSIVIDGNFITWSHPMWVRGLKLLS